MDDLLITGSSKALIEGAKQVLKDNFKIKDLGDLRYFLGIEFASRYIKRNMLCSLFLTWG